MRVLPSAFAVLAITIALALFGEVAGDAAAASPPDRNAVYGLGTVEGKVFARLGFEVAGRLVELKVDQGDRVGAGETLAKLDTAEQESRLALAEAGLREAEAAVGQSKARLERAKALLTQRRSVNDRRQTLVRRGTVSQEAAEDAEAGSAVAAADLAVAASDLEAARGAAEAAKARVRLERAVLAKFTLAAPFHALVVERALELGSANVPGAPAITVVDPATVWVRAFVDEALAGRIAVGQPASIMLRSRPGEPLSGRVARVDIENDRVSEERKVHVVFDHIPADFHLGEQAEVLIDTSRPRP